MLDDDRGVIPPYDAIVLVERAPRARAPGARSQRSRALDGAIDAAAMRRMNLAVDGDGRSPAQVAREFEAARR